MKEILLWAVRRLTCTLTGHRMAAERIYHPQAKSFMPGFRCERCGHEQPMLWRWQSVRNDDENDR